MSFEDESRWIKTEIYLTFLRLIMISLEVVSKRHLMSDGCVMSHFKMLTYYRVRSTFDATQALTSKII